MPTRLLILISLASMFQSCCCSQRAAPMALPSDAIAEAAIQTQSDPVIAVANTMPEEWWTLFHDEQLNEFIVTAFERNPNLQAARATIYLAAAQASKARAALYPNVLWAADVSREKLSETALIPFGANAPGTTGAAVPATPVTPGKNNIPVYFTQYETEFNLTYDFDFWGKNRNTLRAALGEIQADIADEAFSRLQLGIAVAKVYFDLQILYARRDVLQAFTKNKRDFSDLVGRRVKANLDNKLSLQAALADLTVAEEELLIVEGNIAIAENQLRAYLAGTFQEQIATLPITMHKLPKVPLPADLPLHLIARRPDVVSQLWMIESAGRRIDVARAGFYPDFSLTAIFGFQTLHLHKLFEWPSVYYNIDPAVSLPFFDGGRLVANLQSSEVNYDLAIYEYNQRILNAVKEVLDGIAVLQNAEKQLNTHVEKTHLQDELYHLTSLRQAHHLDSALEQLASEAQVLNAKDLELIALGNTYQAALSLIKALGGGYETCVYSKG